MKRNFITNKTNLSLLLTILFFVISSNSYAKTQFADYVIVGTGTAGALLAKELSDDKITSVFALQNGPNLNQDPIINQSENAIFTVLSGLIGPPLYVNGETIPQVNANDRQLRWVQAIPLGGNSSVNAGAFCRGTNQVFSQWEAIAGPLWSLNRILDIYKQLEAYKGQTTNPSARGFNGPLSIQQNPQPSQVSLKFTQAIINATGYPFLLDYNDPNTPIGVSPQMQYAYAGQNGTMRASSALTFLNPYVMRADGHGVGRKLQVSFNSIAMRVIWQGNTAVGVEYYQEGKFKKVFARKGVIVCAGLKSSTFLLYSGVGPKPLLQSLGIPVIFDNPNVGQGLVDQPHLVLLFTSNPNDTTSILNNNTIKLLENIPLGQQLFQTLDQPIQLLINQINQNKFIFANLNNSQNTFPSLFAQTSWLPAPGGDPTIRSVRFSTINPIPGLTVAILDLLQPQSRGSITINSSNPFAPPIIDLGELSNPADLTLYQQALQIYVSAINAAVQAVDPQYQLVFPDPAILNDLGLVTAFIQEEIGSNMHFQCHCRMAPLNQGGVVDSTGHVYGVYNLIVADNSIAPISMDGAPLASAYLIAKNISQILRGF